LTAVTFLRAFLGASGGSGGRTGNERRCVACVPRSFVNSALNDFFRADFHLALAAKTSSALGIHSKRSTRGSYANEQRFGFERQGAILLPRVDCARENLQPSSQARPGARKIAGSLDDKHAAISHCR
jgi:hypothetical protein